MNTNRGGNLHAVMHWAAWDAATTKGTEMTGYESEGDIRALKHRIHELEGELIGYKKIVADQESIMTAQAMRIVDLKTHIENLEGEE